MIPVKTSARTIKNPQGSSLPRAMDWRAGRRLERMRPPSNGGNGKRLKTSNPFRLIKAIIDNTEEKICFVTNLFDEDAYVIADIYKQRWEIEIFFKFIKQNLNVKHLVSHNINGIKVMLYMTMILAILILAYKKLNKIKGYKIAKLKFEIDLDNSIIREIVLLCGGNPNLAKHLWNSP